MPRDGSRRTIGPRDLPALPQNKLPDDVRQPIEAIREAVQNLLGFRGDSLDAAITGRTATQLGILSSSGAFGGVGTGGTGGGAVDLTPPPTVTGLAAAGVFGHVLVSWDAAAYSVGHGHLQTNIYAVQKLASDATLPTFADAQLVYSATGALTLAAIPSDLSIRWHIWAKYETVDGVESASPAGGLHGVVGQTGLIAGVDLGPLIVSADKIAAGAFPNINLVPNGNAEDGLAAWYGDVTGAATFTASGASVRGGSQAFRLNRTGADYAKALSTAFPVIPGETYSVKVAVHTNVATAAGVYVRMYEKATRPPLNYVHDTTLDSFTDLQANGPGTTAWAPLEYQYTVPAGVYWVSFVVLHYSSSTAADVYFDDVSVGRQITASFLAAGSIAVGSAAIANAAIRNALIANAAVDDAKIANLSAIKLTVGTGEVGGPLRSTNYSSGTAGWIVLPSGYAEFNDVDIRGATYTGSIFAGAGTIGGIVIASTDLHSSGFVSGSTGFRIKSDGTAEFQNLTARGNITANALNAATGTFGGAVVVDSTGIYSSGYVAGSSGWKLKADGTAEFRSVTVRGDVQATSLNAATGTFAGTLTAAALVLAGQSLFLPALAASSTATSASTSSWTTILTCASVNPGATGTVAIFVSVMAQAALMGGATGGEGDSSTYGAISYRIQRNGTTIYSFAGPAGYSQPLNLSDLTTDAPGAASVYTLQELAPTGATSGGSGRRSLLALGIVR